MPELPDKLQKKLADRKAQNALRSLLQPTGLVDFSSNDYLGLSSNQELAKNATKYLADKGETQNGATGSRLLSGNHLLYTRLEAYLADFHETEAALVFNSGYDANIGFFSSVPQRGDIVFYDEYIHASIRDGIKLGNAKSFKFKHNNLSDLRKKCTAQLEKCSEETAFYIVTESVFSMDGDSPDLRAIVQFCSGNKYRLIVDEAHAIGVFGNNGAGLVQHLGLQEGVFARIITFGKALGCHGAAILGGEDLKLYLVNFARSFIYTTGLPPHTLAVVLAAYDYMQTEKGLTSRLTQNIQYFKQEIISCALAGLFIPSQSAINCCVVSGNDRVKMICEEIQENGFDVRPILSPTVPKNEERLRICLHSFNTKADIQVLLELLKNRILKH